MRHRSRKTYEPNDRTVARQRQRVEVLRVSCGDFRAGAGITIVERQR